MGTGEMTPEPPPGFKLVDSTSPTAARIQYSGTQTARVGGVGSTRTYHWRSPIAVPLRARHAYSEHGR